MPGEARHPRVLAAIRQRNIRIALEGEVFYPMNMWPQWAVRLYLLAHKDRVQRFSLWLFFVGNGLEPNIARQWILSGGGYDLSAIRQMQELVDIGPQGDYKYWDIALRKNKRFQQF